MADDDEKTTGELTDQGDYWIGNLGGNVPFGLFSFIRCRCNNPPRPWATHVMPWHFPQRPRVGPALIARGKPWSLIGCDTCRAGLAYRLDGDHAEDFAVAIHPGTAETALSAPFQLAMCLK